MTTCVHCGHGNQDDARFCSSCGRPLGRGDEEITDTLQAVEFPNEAREESLRAALRELPPGAAFLVVRSGEDAGSWYALEAASTTLGRHPGSDIFLDDITVSRRHAEIRREGISFVLKDVGSLNGTYLNRARIDEAELAHGDELQIGKYRFIFALYTQGA